MASDPGGRGADARPQPAAGLPEDVARTPHPPHQHHAAGAGSNTSRPTVAEPRLLPAAPLPRISSGDTMLAPRSRPGELTRRRSQILQPGTGGEPPARGTGVQKSTSRPSEQAAAMRRHGNGGNGGGGSGSGPAGPYRPGATAAATRERMLRMLEATASAEDLATLSAPPSRTDEDDAPIKPMSTARPIAVPRTRRTVDVDMLDASMPPPPLPAPAPAPLQPPGPNRATDPGMGAGGMGILSSSLPLQARDDPVTASSSANGGGVGVGGGGGLDGGRGSLKRSASSGSNSSHTVTIIECPILEVDERCGNGDEDLSWLSNDRELEQMLAMTAAAPTSSSSASSSSHVRPGRSSLTFRRSQEAAMQCSQVVRNVPRMRKRRGRKLDRRRQSLTLSESTICLSASPSPTATPVR
ncbi:hypothetical protein V2A60_003897 [Cordyceps javanica]|uniref:Uncharacterized protein n=1 Tax=Cordyceps javanica TaxID=43265 RepID=A0A545UWV9_9HYPO|nr:hypothetical protein IF1G_07682 [Cordyceps javanica]TQW04726.1 hypothetical protein IF2G_07955 [Cordyceps javanica]